MQKSLPFLDKWFLYDWKAIKQTALVWNQSRVCLLNLLSCLFYIDYRVQCALTTNRPNYIVIYGFITEIMWNSEWLDDPYNRIVTIVIGQYIRKDVGKHNDKTVRLCVPPEIISRKHDEHWPYWRFLEFFLKIYLISIYPWLDFSLTSICLLFL